MKRHKSKVFAGVRHTFWLEWEDAAGKRRKIPVKAKVRHPSRPVVIKLLPEHVEKSIKLHGVGDTANCSMAVCAVNHAKAFPHPVEGHIDWTYTRAFVVSKTKNGLPVECFVYDHDNHDIAKLNDSLNGQQKLLKILQDDGPREVTLSPKRIRSRPGRPGKGRKKTGTRDAEARRKLRGGKLRYAFAKLSSEAPEDVAA